MITANSMVQVLLGPLMAVVAPLVLDKDKDVRSAAVSTLQVLVARAVKEADVNVLSRTPMSVSF